MAELWNDGVASTELPLLEAQYERAAAFLPAIDRDQARNCLLARFGAEAMFIADRLGLHTERAMTRASLDHRLLAFDTSPEGKLLRRYTSACTNDFFRYQAALNAHRAGLAAETRGEAGAHRDAPSWPWIEAIPTDVRGESHFGPACLKPMIGNLPIGTGRRGDYRFEQRFAADCASDHRETDSADCHDETVADEFADASDDEKLKALMQAEPRMPRDVGDGASMAPGNVAAAAAGTVVFRPSRSQLKRRRREERRREGGLVAR